MVSRNKSLMAELAYSAAALPPAADDVTGERDKHPVYRFWHDHISGLIAAQRPDTDADMLAHLLLGALQGEPILNELATAGPERLSAALRSLACSVLDAPAAARSGGWCRPAYQPPDREQCGQAIRGGTCWCRHRCC